MNKKKLDRLRIRCELTSAESLLNACRHVIKFSHIPCSRKYGYTLFWSFHANVIAYKGHLTFNQLTFSRKPRCVLGTRRRKVLAAYLQYLTPNGYHVIGAKHFGPGGAMYTLLSDLSNHGEARGHVSIPRNELDRPSGHTQLPCISMTGPGFMLSELRNLFKICTLLQALHIKDLDEPPPVIRDWPLTIYEGSQL